MEQNKYDIFVSYSRADIDIVQNLVAEIHDRTNARCWVDWEGIENGEEFVDVIIKAIDEVDTVLFILSDNSISSAYVKKEILYARNVGKKIYPVVVDGNALRGWFLFEFGPTDYTDIESLFQYEKLFHNLEKRFGCKSLAPEVEPKVHVEKKVPVNTVIDTSSKTYKVGDLYDENGKQGIVFDVTASGKHGKIVSLEEGEGFWANSAVSNKKIDAVLEENGMVNLDMIKKMINWRENYPVSAWCASLGSGWYMPAKKELELIFANNVKINQTLNSIEGDEIKGIYWSSTEYNEPCAWAVNMLDGYTSKFYKDDDLYVRAVAVF